MSLFFDPNGSGGAAVERITNYAAVGAATNPLWIWTIEDVSNGASLLLTLLGIVWFAVQIFYKVRGK